MTSKDGEDWRLDMPSIVYFVQYAHRSCMAPRLFGYEVAVVG